MLCIVSVPPNSYSKYYKQRRAAYIEPRPPPTSSTHPQCHTRNRKEEEIRPPHTRASDTHAFRAPGRATRARVSAEPLPPSRPPPKASPSSPPSPVSGHLLKTTNAINQQTTTKKREEEDGDLI
ncbi:leucine-rich repeat extensin-like protein 3 [Iris pallida]|uniref:Leucine-rich repeat extensin-like protein 3 n=1 Tax=Iris pallida TaxID=29817 RepID=A0AAX6I9T0_IRIPA|nr:leucine-rich repeat extensin-like protein 3 [Iris pallida]